MDLMLLLYNIIFNLFNGNILINNWETECSFMIFILNKENQEYFVIFGKKGLIFIIITVNIRGNGKDFCLDIYSSWKI